MTVQHHEIQREKSSTSWNTEKEGIKYIIEKMEGYCANLTIFNIMNNIIRKKRSPVEDEEREWSRNKPLISKQNFRIKVFQYACLWMWRTHNIINKILFISDITGGHMG